MKSVLIACPMILFTLAALAQMPSAPKLPTESSPPMAAPTAPTLPSSGTSPMAAPMAAPIASPSSGSSSLGTGGATNAIDQAKTEAECKIPTNATKPECVELLLKK